MSGKVLMVQTNNGCPQSVFSGRIRTDKDVLYHHYHEVRSLTVHKGDSHCKKRRPFASSWF